jgi:hypothetical protein
LAQSAPQHRRSGRLVEDSDDSTAEAADTRFLNLYLDVRARTRRTSRGLPYLDRAQAVKELARFSRFTAGFVTLGSGTCLLSVLAPEHLLGAPRNLRPLRFRLQSEAHHTTSVHDGTPRSKSPSICPSMTRARTTCTRDRSHCGFEDGCMRSGRGKRPNRG